LERKKKKGKGGEERGNGEHVAGFVRKKPKEQKQTFLKSIWHCAYCLCMQKTVTLFTREGIPAGT